MRTKVVFAFFILVFFYFNFAGFNIPTPAMEGTILVGDHIVVSKLSFGIRLPSFTNNISRLPGFGKPSNGDLIVFNVPNYLLDGDATVSFKTNYIKRCIGTPGDKLEIRDQQVYLNDKPMENPPKLRQEYFLKTSENLDDAFFRKYDIVNTFAEIGPNINWQPVEQADSTGANVQLIGYKVNTNKENFDLLKKLPFVKGTESYFYPKNQRDSMDGATKDPENTAMGSMRYNWNRDNFGPLVVPKEGLTVKLDSINFDKYKYVIQNYEGNKNVTFEGTTIKVDGKPITEYTFKQDYYFMMGDNRHNSADSRYWGFVPFDHVVGKAVFIWMSMDPNPDKWYNKIRWNRLFNFVK